MTRSHCDEVIRRTTCGACRTAFVARAHEEALGSPAVDGQRTVRLRTRSGEAGVDGPVTDYPDRVALPDPPGPRSRSAPPATPSAAQTIAATNGYPSRAAPWTTGPARGRKLARSWPTVGTSRRRRAEMNRIPLEQPEQERHHPPRPQGRPARGAAARRGRTRGGSPPPTAKAKSRHRCWRRRCRPRVVTQSKPLPANHPTASTTARRSKPAAYLMWSSCADRKARGSHPATRASRRPVPCPPTSATRTGE